MTTDDRDARAGELDLAPTLLEQMRQIGLRLDRAGELWHAGAAVTHARLRQALLRWLDVREDGRDIVRLDAERYAYVDVEDAHLRARRARWDGARCLVLWDDDRETELDYADLRQAADHALYTHVPAAGAAARGSLRARIGGAAYHAIAERVVEVPAEVAATGFALEAAGARWPIRAA